MNEKNESSEYENLENLAKDSKNLLFELLRDRVLRFDLIRTLEINTFFLNYFLLQNYFTAFDLQDEIINKRNLTDKQSTDMSFFRGYIERLHGIFIMIPMKYKRENIYTKGKTDKIINKIHAYGDFVNYFFSSHENLPLKRIDDIERLLKDYVITNHFLPSLDFDPEFQKILDSKATNQLFLINRSKKYLNKHSIKRYNYPVDKEIKSEFRNAMNNWNERLFSFDPELDIYNRYLLHGINFIGVMDFGSRELIKEVITLFKDYYTLRIPSRKEEIKYFLDFYEKLFSLSKGRLYRKFRLSTLRKELLSLRKKKLVTLFLERVCLFKDFLDFPNNLDNFDPYNFLSNYYEFLNYGCCCYSGQIYTGATLIWRSLIKYLEELQQTKEFKILKGSLLENCCLKIIENYGFQVEKVILRNKNISPNDNYFKMKEQIKSFEKDPLEFEVEFIEHQNRYPFHEFDLIFKVEKLIFIIECKSTAIKLSHPPKYILWGKKFENVFSIHNKKIDNLIYNIENGSIIHPLFDDITEYIPLIIQTEGLFHGTYGFDTDKFRKLLANIMKHHKKGDLMKPFEK